MKLKVEIRDTMDHKPGVAPFINDWNVWTIPKKEWTTSVQMAVLHAYQISARHAITAAAKAAGEAADELVGFSTINDWPEAE